MSTNNEGWTDQRLYEQTRTGTGSSNDINQHDVELEHESTKTDSNVVLPSLPEITPSSDLGLDLDLFGSSSVDMEKVQKRASNVQKLAQENEKLKAELKAMSDRLEAAEKRKEELSQKRQMIKEPPTN